MFETKRLLKVPKDKTVRNKLRDEVGLFVSENPILPPSDLPTLEKYAGTILEKSAIDQQYLEFIIVLLGNEIWRKTVAATPFNRRLLLLPQCLKSTLNCKAEIDNLGLICAGCKSCPIDSILNVANSLSYTTLVAEGTTVAIGLVEEGSVDAVIGVSCMPVLQRSFEPVTRAAVPAIGLPLLYDGCENTDLDYSWLMVELKQFVPDSDLKPISVSLLKNQVEDTFSLFNLKKYFPLNNFTEELALKVMAMGGQRMRPLLSALAYQSYSKIFSIEVQELLSVIIECFHKASLVHDDIEDDEDTRYGQPALHRSEGIPVAVNTGDYLIGKGYRLLSGLPLPPETLARCLQIVSSSHVTLSMGQGADILFAQNILSHSVDEVIQIFKHKTGEAVKVALLTGAIAGNAPENDLAILESFSDQFGIAYQIRDDLNEFSEKNEKEHIYDFPFLLALLIGESKSKGFALNGALKSKTTTEARELFGKFGIESIARHHLGQFIERCFHELDKLGNRKLRLSLYGLTNKIFRS